MWHCKGQPIWWSAGCLCVWLTAQSRITCSISLSSQWWAYHHDFWLFLTYPKILGLMFTRVPECVTYGDFLKWGWGYPKTMGFNTNMLDDLAYPILGNLHIDIWHSFCEWWPSSITCFWSCSKAKELSRGSCENPFGMVTLWTESIWACWACVPWTS